MTNVFSTLCSASLTDGDLVPSDSAMARQGRMWRRCWRSPEQHRRPTNRQPLLHRPGQRFLPHNPSPQGRRRCLRLRRPLSCRSFRNHRRLPKFQNQRSSRFQRSNMIRHVIWAGAERSIRPFRNASKRRQRGLASAVSLKSRFWTDRAAWIYGWNATARA